MMALDIGSEILAVSRLKGALPLGVYAHALGAGKGMCGVVTADSWGSGPTLGLPQMSLRDLQKVVAKLI